MQEIHGLGAYIMNKNKKIVVEFTNERIIPASGLAVVGAIL